MTTNKFIQTYLDKLSEFNGGSSSAKARTTAFDSSMLLNSADEIRKTMSDDQGDLVDFLLWKLSDVSYNSTDIESIHYPSYLVGNDSSLVTDDVTMSDNESTQCTIDTSSHSGLAELYLKLRRMGGHLLLTNTVIEDDYATQAKLYFDQRESFMVVIYNSVNKNLGYTLITNVAHYDITGSLIQKRELSQTIETITNHTHEFSYGVRG